MTKFGMVTHPEKTHMVGHHRPQIFDTLHVWTWSDRATIFCLVIPL